MIQAPSPLLQLARECRRTGHRLRVALGRPRPAIEGKDRRSLSAEIEVALDRTPGVELRPVDVVTPQLDVADDAAFVHQFRAGWEGQVTALPGAGEDGALHARAAVGAARARRLDRGTGAIVDLAAMVEPDRGLRAANLAAAMIGDDRRRPGFDSSVDVATERTLVVQIRAALQHDGARYGLAARHGKVRADHHGRCVDRWRRRRRGLDVRSTAATTTACRQAQRQARGQRGVHRPKLRHLQSPPH